MKYLTELIPNCKPVFVNEYIYNTLPRYTYSDTGKRIKKGHLMRWIFKTIPPQRILNGGVCNKELMLVRWK